jgi:hypothetical protein
LWLGGVMAGFYATMLIVVWMPPWDVEKVLLVTILCLVQRWTLLGATLLTICVDRPNELLVLTYQSLLTKESTGIALKEIASVDVDTVWSDGRSDHVVIGTRDGRMTPLRRYAMFDSEGIARELRELLGVGGSRLLPHSDLDEVLDRHEALIAPYANGHETSGVCWKVQSSSQEQTPFARWFSPDFKTDGEFVYIIQKPPNQQFPRGIFGERAMWRSLSFYNYKSKDVPRLGQARAVELDAELSAHYAAFASDESTAKEVLNRMAVQALSDWADRHPLQTVPIGYPVGQLTMLCCPRGVFVSVHYLCRASQLNDVIAAGVQLVRGQTGQ